VTAASVVLDASVLIRSAVVEEPAAREWIRSVEAGEVDAHVPELAYAEIVSGLLKYVRANLVAPTLAAEILEGVVKLPLSTHGHAGLAGPSLALAVELGLSAYDACYVALVVALDAPLITTDRRLAAAVPASELLP
jgi:predicted nucleic acid-binding protein